MVKRMDWLVALAMYNIERINAMKRLSPAELAEAFALYEQDPAQDNETVALDKVLLKLKLNQVVYYRKAGAMMRMSTMMTVVTHK